MEFNLTNSIIKMQQDASGEKPMSEEDILQEFIALRDYNIELKKQLQLLTKNVKLIGKPSLFGCLLYTSPSPRDGLLSRMPSSA